MSASLQRRTFLSAHTLSAQGLRSVAARALLEKKSASLQRRSFLSVRTLADGLLRSLLRMSCCDVCRASQLFHLARPITRWIRRPTRRFRVVQYALECLRLGS